MLVIVEPRVHRLQPLKRLRFQQQPMNMCVLEAGLFGVVLRGHERRIENVDGFGVVY